MSGPITFLVASPHLHGGVFEGTVILLLEHDTKGAMGLIVNAPLPQSVSELMADTPGQEQPGWLGGPVDPTLGWCLYRDPMGLDGEVHVVDGLMVSSSLEVLRAVMNSGQPYRLVLGYAGWGAGQLTEEAREGAWVWVEQDTPELLWDVPPEQQWAEALKRLGVTPGTIMPGGAQA
ncbi:YqgE/AlgH family protein [Deinococcus sp. KSM4-11]|uniref:YqgE/AlgH family protein n=1 Tax=Deinococcus sp. KSM4-11 TaxID=2568654 RepID=UPI0010A5878A|nr:YqgE/AlgH family protein [Deinococcus sp. KSM4-11]THF85084.1 YqgE/AlgH family protein [Deinococcus sp. KSM4-11]